MATLRDSAFPKLGIVILLLTHFSTSFEIPWDSFPNSSTPGVGFTSSWMDSPSKKAPYTGSFHS
jgi:hypothetical protein